MTIKQQGGIFGRNPTFNNVDVDGVLTVDTITEKTGASGVTLDGVTLKDGNVVLANGQGIDFSATSGTGTSELFDDYEEGTWTPSYDASTSSPTVTHDKQTGYYVKIGRMVFISLQLRTDSVSGGSGNLRISGLPYSAGSGDGYPSALSIGYKADFVTNGPDFAHVNDGQTYLSLYSNGTTVATPLTVANLQTGSNDNGLYISGSYLTS
jgi:hypothetical protein